MGCTTSSFDIACQKTEFKLAMVQFHAMKMSTSDIKALYDSFIVMDIDKSGSIGLPELLAHVDLPRTVFTEKIFSVFDHDKSGEIDFKEFVLALWNYCTLTGADLDMFAFELYDKDGGGSLSPDEIHDMIEDIYGKREMKTNAQAKTVTAELKAFSDTMETFNVKRFHEYIKTHQAMLFPAFQMQLALQRKFLGVPYWEKSADKRIKLCKGKYISIEKFLLSRGDRIAPNVDGTPGEYDGPFSPEELSLSTLAGAKIMSNHKAANAQHNFPKFKDVAAHAGDGSLARPAFGSSFGESAKQRWAASVQTVSGVLSGKHSNTKKKAHKNNKVYVTATSSASRSNNITKSGSSTGGILASHGSDSLLSDLHKTAIALNHWSNEQNGTALNRNGTLMLTPSQSPPRDPRGREPLRDFVPRRMSRGSREHSVEGGHAADWAAGNSSGNHSKNNSFSLDHSMNDSSMNFEDWHESHRGAHGDSHGYSHGQLSRGHSNQSLNSQNGHHNHHSSDKDRKQHNHSSDKDKGRSGHGSHSSDKERHRQGSTGGHHFGENSPDPRPRRNSNSNSSSSNNKSSQDHLYNNNPDSLVFAQAYSTGADGHKLSSGRGNGLRGSHSGQNSRNSSAHNLRDLASNGGPTASSSGTSQGARG